MRVGVPQNPSLGRTAGLPEPAGDRWSHAVRGREPRAQHRRVSTTRERVVALGQPHAPQPLARASCSLWLAASLATGRDVSARSGGTMLHQLGLDHEHLTFNHNSRDERLTDVYKARVIQELIA